MLNMDQINHFPFFFLFEENFSLHNSDTRHNKLSNVYMINVLQSFVQICISHLFCMIKEIEQKVLDQIEIETSTYESKKCVGEINFIRKIGENNFRSFVCSYSV